MDQNQAVQRIEALKRRINRAESQRKYRMKQNFRWKAIIQFRHKKRAGSGYLHMWIKNNSRSCQALVKKVSNWKAEITAMKAIA